jgi:Domain of unknown function (DUF5668)
VPAFRRPSLFWPLVLIGLGVLLLLQTLGLLPASLWAALAQLWPLLFIVFGLDLLVGRRSPRGAATVLIVGGVLVAGSLTWAAVRASQLPAGAVETLVQTPQGAARVSARIDFQTGQLHVSALDASDHLLEASAHDGPGETLQQGYAVSDGEGRLVLQQHPDPLLAPFLSRRSDTAQWEVRIARHLPLALEVDSSAGALTLDLTNLQLTSLDLNSGLGATVVTFPTGQAAQAQVRTGLGPVTLNLPAGLPVRLLVRSGLTHVSLPTTLTRAGDDYTTAAFDPASPFLDLELSAGMGSVTIK